MTCTLCFSAWLLATIASLGSLFFSDVMAFIPCSLCWYQRIAMYPLVVILLVGLFPFDGKVVKFALPLAFIGLMISLYHNLLHWGIVPESAAPCVQGIPCSTQYINWLGFITIPVLSMAAFSIIFILLLLLRKQLNES